MNVKICLIGIIDKFDKHYESLRTFINNLKKQEPNTKVSISLVFSNIVCLRHNIENVTSKNKNMVRVDSSNPLIMKHSPKSTNYKILNMKEVVHHCRDIYSQLSDKVHVCVVDDIAFDESFMMQIAYDKTMNDHVKYQSDLFRYDLTHLINMSHFYINKLSVLAQHCVTDPSDTIYFVNRFDTEFPWTWNNDWNHVIDEKNIVGSRGPLFSGTFLATYHIFKYLTLQEFMNLDVNTLDTNIVHETEDHTLNFENIYKNILAKNQITIHSTELFENIDRS